MALPDGAAQIFASVIRLAPLTPAGNVAVGANCYATNTLIKLTLNPAMETGVDLVTINGNGDIGSHYKHGDMPKYYNATLEMVTPDPILMTLLSGGLSLTDSGTALSTPVLAAPTPSASGGSLIGGTTYYYRVTAANQYGETLAAAEQSATISGGGSAGSVALSVTAVTNAVWYRWYGRTSGNEQLLAQTTATTWTDTGTATAANPINSTPASLPASNQTAGPGGDTGWQSPALGIVGNPYGVSFELWGQAILNGTQTPTLPWYRYVVPGVRNLQPGQKDFGAQLLPNTWTGQAFENLNWGSGPLSDWQFDSSKVYQYARAGNPTVPVSGWSAIVATG